MRARGRVQLVLLWFGFAYLGAGLVGAGTAYVLHRLDRFGENFHKVPVLVFRQDLPAGTPVDASQVQSKLFGDSCLQSWVVRPDSFGHLRGKKLGFPVRRGDLVSWGLFETPDAKTCAVLCGAQ